MLRPSQILVALAALVPSAAFASLPLQTPESLARRSDRVVKARVVAQVQERDTSGTREAYVVSTLQVAQTLLGEPVGTISLVQLGGQVDQWKSGVVGDAVLQRGEEAVFFLRCRDAKAPTRCTLVGLGDGRMPWNARSQTVQLPRRPGVKAAGAAGDVSLEQLRARVKAAHP